MLDDIPGRAVFRRRQDDAEDGRQARRRAGRDVGRRIPVPQSAAQPAGDRRAPTNTRSCCRSTRPSSSRPSSSSTDQPLVSWQAYRMRNGETLPQVAAKFGMPVESLRAVNGIGAKAKVPAGHTLLVPVAAADARTRSDALAQAVFTTVPQGRTFYYRVNRGDTLARHRGPLRRQRAGHPALERARAEPRSTPGQSLRITSDLAPNAAQGEARRRAQGDGVRRGQAPRPSRDAAPAARKPGRGGAGEVRHRASAKTRRGGRRLTRARRRRSSRRSGAPQNKTGDALRVACFFVRRRSRRDRGGLAARDGLQLLGPLLGAFFLVAFLAALRFGAAFLFLVAFFAAFLRFGAAFFFLVAFFAALRFLGAAFFFLVAFFAALRFVAFFAAFLFGAAFFLVAFFAASSSGRPSWSPSSSLSASSPSWAPGPRPPASST